MKKYLFIIALSIFTVLPLNSFGKDLELNIKSYECTEDGILVTYTIVNERNFTRPNISVGFKVEIDNEIAACKEVKVSIPVGSEDHLMEAVIPAPCKDKTYKLITTVFPSGVSRYKIENWFKGCK